MTISLSEEWIALSRAMCGQELINELAEFLQNQKIKTILECGCGDGYILHGLAKNGFKGLGIDSNDKMIETALQNNTHKNIDYRKMNWLDIGKLREDYDAVMCRGNSLILVDNWEKSSFNKNELRANIEKSVELFFNKTKKEGLIYIDTISQREINSNGGKIELKSGDVDLKGEIKYDWDNRIRIMYGGGKVNEEDFSGCSISYLITPNELEGIIRSFNPSEIFKPNLKHEKMYEVICARK